MNFQLAVSAIRAELMGEFETRDEAQLFFDNLPKSCRARVQNWRGNRGLVVIEVKTFTGDIRNIVPNPTGISRMKKAIAIALSMGYEINTVQRVRSDYTDNEARKLLEF